MLPMLFSLIILLVNLKDYSRTFGFNINVQVPFCLYVRIETGNILLAVYLNIVFPHICLG